jgi:hypothetical protein
MQGTFRDYSGNVQRLEVRACKLVGDLARGAISDEFTAVGKKV